MVVRVHALGRAHLLRQLELVRIDVDADDPTRADLLCTEHHGEPDSTQSEYSDRVPCLHLGGVVNCAEARRDATPQRQTGSSAASSATVASEVSGTTVYSLNVLVPM